jgi:uncharacterized protein (TIGR03437 family)
MLRHLALLIASAWLIVPASAQLTSQATLTGVYNVRYLGVLTDPADTAVSFSGSLTFDGKGGYTVTGQGTTAGAALKYRTTGTYTVTSSGMMYLDNPFDPVASNGTLLYGGIGANGAILASSTDTLYCDLFIAIPAATSSSAATLTGSYKVSSMEFLNGDFTATRNAFFTMTADAKGGLGNVSVQGTALNLKNVATTQTSTGATYTLTANGTGTLILPAPAATTAPNTLVSGTKLLYVSSDGNFFVAGSANGYDMQIGVKTGGATALNGLYWNSYLQNYQESSDPTVNGMYSGQGSANEIASAGNLEIAHQRTNPDGFASYDITFSDNFTFDATGTLSFSDQIYAVGANGSIAIAAGQSSNYMLAVYLKAPTMTPPAGTTVFLNPQGVVNGANNVPITAQMAPGEVITLFGTGMGPSALAVASAPFPTTLSGVQVIISAPGMTATPAPLYYVSATQIAAVVPNNAPTDGSFLTIQVTNNGAQSNPVNIYSGPSSPSLYTQDQTGVHAGSIRHLDGSYVTSANPAKSGETVIMAMNGLGAVSPVVAAGAAAPSTTLSNLVNPLFVGLLDADFNYSPAKVLFSGLFPGFAGLYQVNVTLPTGLTAGDYAVDIETTFSGGQALDSDNYQAIISIGG